jgi:hypothetical protein
MTFFLEEASFSFSNCIIFVCLDALPVVMCVYIYIYIYIYTLYHCNAPGSQNRVLDPLGPEV